MTGSMSAILLESASGNRATIDNLPSVFPLPLTALERFLFQCDTVDSPMVIRVVLRFTETCDLRIFLDTLDQAIRRHPLMNCRIIKQGRKLSWVEGPAAKPLVRHVSGSVFEPFCEPVSQSIDLTVSTGLSTEIRCLDDGMIVVMDVHHAISDGNGMRQVITDWLHLYHCQMTGTTPRLPLMDVHRLQQRHTFPQPAAVEPISFRDGLRNLLATVRGRTARWVNTRTLKPSSRAASGSCCVEQTLSREQYDAIQQRLVAYKVTLNDLMIVSCMSSFARLAPGGSSDHRITVLNPTDLRLPSDRFLPATNRFGFAFLRRKRSDCLNPARLLQCIHEEMTYIRSRYVGVEFIKGLETASKIPGGVDFLRKLGLFTPSLQWTCLGDITRGARRLMSWKDGVLSAGGLRLETATAFAAFAENVPFSVATCEAGTRITLTVRSSLRFVTPEETYRFADSLVHQLCTFELPASKP